MHGRNELEEKHTSKLLIFLKLVRVPGAAHQTLVSCFNWPAIVQADAGHAHHVFCSLCVSTEGPSSTRDCRKGLGMPTLYNLQCMHSGELTGVAVCFQGWCIGHVWGCVMTMGGWRGAAHHANADHDLACGAGGSGNWQLGRHAHPAAHPVRQRLHCLVRSPATPRLYPQEVIPWHVQAPRLLNLQAVTSAPMHHLSGCLRFPCY